MRRLAASLRALRQELTGGVMEARRIGFGALTLLALAGMAMSVGACEDDGSPNPGISFPEAGSFDANRPDTGTTNTPIDSGTDAGGPIAVFGATSFDLGAGDCGGSASKSVTFQNTGTKELTVNLTASGAPFTVTPT